MADPTSNAAPTDGLIAGVFEVDFGTALAGAGGGLPAYAVRDRTGVQADLMAVQVARGAPARPMPLSRLASMKMDNLVYPLAHGSVPVPRQPHSCFVIAPRPPGPALLPPDAPSFPPWGESELLTFLLRPAALVLDQLNTAGITHRSIRPDNLFRARAGSPVTLGCAWAAPPASSQPALFEPPYAALCHPAGRGDGSIADDVYALGVVLLILAIGHVPLPGLESAAIIRRKLELGSYAALVGNLRLPPAIADLVRGMLAEDPEHRPLPVLLTDPMVARSRRVAARPPARAQRPLGVGDVAVWDARNLGHALGQSPDIGVRMLRGLLVDNWLRRSLGDQIVAARMEEAVNARVTDTATPATQADAILLMRAVAILDPLAPLCWRDLVVWPDGIGTVLAHAAHADAPDAEAMRGPIEALVMTEAAASWADARASRVDPAVVRLDTRLHRLLLRINGWAGGSARLCYSLNPLLPCRSPLLGPGCVVTLRELLPALERHAGSAVDLIDRDIAGFISARYSGRMDADFATLAQPDASDIDPPGHRALAQLRILARLCTPDGPPWTRLAAACMRGVTTVQQRWSNQSARRDVEARLLAAVSRGSLTTMLEVLDDTRSQEQDRLGLVQAKAALREIEADLLRLAGGTPGRDAQARNTGQEIAAAIGVIALAGAAVLTALS